MIRPFRSLFALSLLMLAGAAAAEESASRVKVWENLFSIRVQTDVPLPVEVTNVTQAKALAREAAVSMGQAALLQHVLAKKARSGRPLSVAEVPSTELQNNIRGLVVGVEVRRTQFTNKTCRVDLTLPKSKVKPLLKNN